MLGNKLKIAVVGSGPAGFYTAHQLIKKLPNVFVDIFEKLPIPFGLVRFGVAPDHPEVKNVINQFSNLARSEQCRFIGNVNIGADISVTKLKKSYSGVVLAYGAENDNRLNIPGEDMNGVYSARSFVGWYNGLPDHADLNPNLSGETAVIVGHGNVALDIARILLSPLEQLKNTDICSHAIEQLCRSNVKRVILIGRRGPLQVAFTIKELREMIRLPGSQAVLHQQDFNQCGAVVNDLARPRRRITELLMKTADDIATTQVLPSATTRGWELKFLSSPVEVLSNSDGMVNRVKLEKNQLTEKGQAKGTGEFEEIECSLLIKSIGYRSTSIDSCVPFDSQKGIIPNKDGRVWDLSSNEIIRGLYCSGWVKRGPVGVIVTTMNDAFQTAQAIINDINNGTLLPKKSKKDIVELIERPVLFSDWEKIDEEEQRRGKDSKKPREKITSVNEMLKLVR